MELRKGNDSQQQGGLLWTRVLGSGCCNRQSKAPSRRWKMLSISRVWRSSGDRPHRSSSSNSRTTPKSCLSCSAPCRLKAGVQCGHLTLLSLQTVLPHLSPSLFQFHSSPCPCLLFSLPEPDPMGKDVVKPGTQGGCQCLAQGRSLGLGWQPLQALQHRFQYNADHQSGILTRNTGKFWSHRTERTGYKAIEVLMECLGEKSRISGRGSGAQ